MNEKIEEVRRGRKTLIRSTTISMKEGQRSKRMRLTEFASIIFRIPEEPVQGKRIEAGECGILKLFHLIHYLCVTL